MPKVHQIWVGPPIPNKERQWTAEIKAAATAAGWDYTLYGLPELLEALQGDPVIARLSEYCAIMPNKPKLAGVISDYSRLALVNTYNGLYMDTDWKYRGGTWPEFPQEPDLYAQGGCSANNQAVEILWLPPGAQSDKLKRLQTAAAQRVLNYFPDLSAGLTFDDIAEKIKNLPFLPQFIGPQWIRKTIGTLTLLPRTLADFSFRTPGARLVHHSQWRWNHDAPTE